MPENARQYAALTLMFVAGYAVRQYELKKFNIPKAEKLFHKSLRSARSDGFHAGFTAAVNDPTIEYQHYRAFQDRMDNQK